MPSAEPIPPQGDPPFAAASALEPLSAACELWLQGNLELVRIGTEAFTLWVQACGDAALQLLEPGPLATDTTRQLVSSWAEVCSLPAAVRLHDAGVVVPLLNDA